MTLIELRKEFEEMAMNCSFDLKRNKKPGEYIGFGGQTFCLWAGYWECAKAHGIITGNDADFMNMHK